MSEAVIQQRTQRENWADYAKLIGIFFVVFAHVNHSRMYLGSQSWIYSFHMPLFLVLAGYFASTTKRVSDVAKSSAKSLIVPYICFYLIAFLAESLLFVFKPEYVFSFYRDIQLPMMGLLIGRGDHTSISQNINIPIWFLLALFFCRILFQFIITRGFNQTMSLLFGNIVCVVLVLMLKHFSVTLFFSLDSALLAMPFYTFGFLLKKYKLLNCSSGWKTILIIILFSIISVIGSLYNAQNGGAVDMRNVEYGNNMLVFYVVGIIGSLIIITVGRMLNQKNYSSLLLLGKNTLIILGTHYWIYHYILKLWVTFNFSIDRELVMFMPDRLVISSIVILLSFPAIYIINRYFPFIIGKHNISNN